MCLDTLDKETKQVTEGWKVFRTINNRLPVNTKNTKFFGMIRQYVFEINKWIKDYCKHNITSTYNKQY